MAGVGDGAGEGEFRLGEGEGEQGGDEEVYKEEPGKRDAAGARPADLRVEEVPEGEAGDDAPFVPRAEGVQGNDHGQGEEAEDGERSV